MIPLLLRGQHEPAGTTILLSLQQLQTSCDYFAAMLRFTSEQNSTDIQTDDLQELDTGNFARSNQGFSCITLHTLHRL